MSRVRQGSISAIPTTYRGVRFRSRLEAKWACVFDSLEWTWSYEALDLRAAGGRGRIPDFVLHLQHPTIVECKPAFELAELAAHRRQMIATAGEWLCSNAERELRAIDAMPDDPHDLPIIDDLVETIIAVRDHGENPRVPGRRAIVVGSRIHISTLDAAHLDGAHYFATCAGGHVGLFAPGPRDWCLACGRAVAAPLPSAKILTRWLDAGNVTRWEPRAPR